jgi:hypothetical protein
MDPNEAFAPIGIPYDLIWLAEQLDDFGFCHSDPKATNGRRIIVGSHRYAGGEHQRSAKDNTPSHRCPLRMQSISDIDKERQIPGQRNLSLIVCRRIGDIPVLSRRWTSAIALREICACCD